MLIITVGGVLITTVGGGTLTGFGKVILLVILFAFTLLLVLLFDHIASFH